MATVYRAARADALRTVAMDGLTFIYHRASGITHIVGAPVPEILSALADAPLAADALLQLLARDFDLADPSLDALDARLAELVDAGLVERLVDPVVGDAA